MIELSTRQFEAVVTGQGRGLCPVELTQTLGVLAEVPDFALSDVRGLRERIEEGETQWMFQPSSSVSVYMGMFDSRDDAIQGAIKRLRRRAPDAPAGTVLSGRIYPYGLNQILYPDGVVEYEVEGEEPATRV